MKNNLHVFLGATVADAAARPLHWVYNQKKLKMILILFNPFLKIKELQLFKDLPLVWKVFLESLMQRQ